MTCLLVTGGTGSLGRAIVDGALAGGVYDRVVVFSSDEFKQAMMHEEAGRIGETSNRLRFFIGNIRDLQRLQDAMVGVTHVIHCAALKWVGDGVYNPTEVIHTNVLGTENVIRAATERGVRQVLCITSDKGCAPVNIYGASKLMTEHLAVAQNAVAFPRGTAIACLRLGNLLWSRGSVAHRFEARMRRGEPLQLTDDRMTRFGIQMPAAAALATVLVAQLRGGEVFVPKLPAFRIRDVAEAVYNRFLARKPGAAPIAVTGHRKGGERLYEILLTPEEASHTVWVDELGCYIVEPQVRSWDRPAWKGDPLAEGFTLRSDQPRAWMAFEDLRTSLRDMDKGLVSV